MSTFKCLVRVEVKQTIKTTKTVVVQAKDANKAKLQLEILYGKGALVEAPFLLIK